MTSRQLALVLTALVVLTAGCKVSTDDELAPPPTKTITASPSQSIDPAPATIPVGHGQVSPTDVVWAQGGVLHVGGRQVDLSPIHVDAFVVVEGGVFVLADGELWFTDLERVRGTGQTDVTRVRLNKTASELVVTDTRSGQPLEQGYDTRTGKAIRGEVDVLTPEEVRAGPGRHDVPRAGVPASFELRGWTSDTTFYGVAGRSVVACDAVKHRCAPVGRATGDAPLVFGGGL